MELVTSHKVYYSNREHIPITDIADSLIALEELIQQTPQILEAIFPGTQISQIEVSLNELKSGSLWEDIGVKFIFGSQEKMDVFIENAREKLGMEKLVSNPQLFSAILAIMILSGGAYYVGSQSSSAEEKATIQANNNVIINIGAGMVDMTPENFKTLIDGAIKEPEKVTKSAVRIIKPAKLDPEARVEFDGNPDISINKDSIKAMPSVVNKPVPEEEFKDIDGLKIEIRATDLDSFKKGWAAVLPSIHESRRVKLQLDPTIDPDYVMKHPRLTGNATVLYKLNDKDEQIPYLVFLREVTHPKPTSN